ncbi:uncharacterized protein LOC143531164 [Bidens hawaiensis]|uniref:uncharacterized protein LOC143531164 n=1 Tax=Bidens hawaiensis TaxID=980011 RepID=UPI00404AB696
MEQFMKLKSVTYERFCSAYWRHFNSKLTKSLDPSTVYTEIMSVIKGGLVTVKAPNGILLRDDYVALCDGRTSIFDAQTREIIYSIFCQYENKKVENGNFDLADLVNDLHQRLEVEGYKGDLMDYVYVDEVQDLSMRQIMLFKYVCRNVHEGFTFSGDTAQAIAKGIGFRFEDIRCMFFKEFLGSEKGKISEILQLSENFRTHAGVLNLAQSVINLLCHFFPMVVDTLSPETSRICGDLPILLETDTNSNAIKFIFERKGALSQQITAFGAEQVVLVRDESLKEKVIEIVGKNALVLTIMESKGLEFQDLLLYDFFTTSSFSNEWRIIYDYMKNKDLLHSPSTMMPLCFDMQKHTVLCSELKQLYVAISRTRQRLWICESIGFSEPVYNYWKELSLVEVKLLSDSFVDKMNVPSSKDEWRSRGIKLFHENNFRMAHMCFLKAGDKSPEKLAKTYHLREIGRASQLEKKNLLKDAAELFSSIGKKELAAECFYEIGDYITAGSIYKSESISEKAGNCFYLAKCYDLAVEEYAKAGAFAKCLSVCTDGKLFETGFELLGRCGECGCDEQKFLKKGAHHYFSMNDFISMMKFVRSFCEKGEMRSFLTTSRCFDELIFLEKEWGNFKEAEKVKHKGASYYFSIKDFESMMKFVRLFCDKGEMRSFLTENRRYDELILLEKEWGNFEEAAKVARLKPDPMLEAELFHMGGLNRESSLIILWHVFLNSPIFQNAKEPFQQKDRLLRQACSIAKGGSDDFYQFVCQEAKILSHGETKEELLEKAIEFIYCYKENALAVSLERVKTSHEIKKIETNVIALIRSFLRSTNQKNKLLLLHEVCGEFVEAAKIGDDDENSIEAALSRLWYVFFGSLWACKRRAWPLKDFKNKAELLDVAKAYVTDHPDSQDSALVHTEIHAFSGEEISLAHLWRYMKETPREKSLRIHFLISRRILDIHLSSHCKVYAGLHTQVEDERINHLEVGLVESIVSVEGLIYFWNCWKEIICELINWSHTRGRDCELYEAFIFNYFGVRKYDVNRLVVLDVEAHWVKETRPVMILNGYLHIILPHQFSSAASRYWCSELLFVAEKVFRSLHAYSTEKNLSMHEQAKILTCMFEVVKSLQKYKFPNSWKHAGLIVDNYSQLCVDQFLWNVTHVNWKHAQSKEMICMRGNNEAFLNMLKEAININSKSLKFGHLGRIAMVLLGYKWTGFNERELRCSSPEWAGLFRKFMNRDRSVTKAEDLAISLYGILGETFCAGWRGVDNCMSPSCFLYIMDRLLILSFCFRGYVFTTRSSCVEWLSYEEWEMGLNGGCLDTIHHSLAPMVIKMLNSQDELMEWLRRSKEPESSYPILVLRLTVLLSLICANSGLHYHELSRQLARASLPSNFCVALFNGIKEDRLVEAVAVACKMIDNPLVIVSAKEDFPKVQCQNAIYLNMEKLKFDQESFIEMLYHKECKDTQW